MCRHCRWLCTAVVNNAEVRANGSARTQWDRALSLDCAPWSFDAGTQYVSVAFHGQPGYDATPLRGAPGADFLAVSKLTAPFADPPADLFAAHSHWFLSYASAYDNVSHYTWAIGSQRADAFALEFNKVDFLRLLVWGAPMAPPNAFDSYVLMPLLKSRTSFTRTRVTYTCVQLLIGRVCRSRASVQLRGKPFETNSMEAPAPPLCRREPDEPRPIDAGRHSQDFCWSPNPKLAPTPQLLSDTLNA